MSLQKLKTQLHSKTPFIGRWIRRAALNNLAADGSSEALDLLAEATVNHHDEDTKHLALNVLQKLAEQSNKQAQEALCRLVIEENHPLARQLTLAAPYTPEEPYQRALFYFLTAQWDKYQDLDFNQSLLNTAYQFADTPLRQRIIAQAREAGRTEWIDVVAGKQKQYHLAKITDKEWESILTLLTQEKLWEKMWHLAQISPITWSRQLLLALKIHKWQPQAEDIQAIYHKLMALAEACTGPLPNLGHLIHCQQMLRVGSFEHLALSPDAKLVASSEYKTINLWRLPDGKCVKSLNKHIKSIKALAISPDSTLLISGARYDEAVCLWQLSDGALIKTLSHPFGIDTLAISPKGDLLACATRNPAQSIQLWRLPDGSPLDIQPWKVGMARFLPHTVAISANNKFLISGHEEGQKDERKTSLNKWHWQAVLRVCQLPGGKTIKRIPQTSPITCLSISPDSSLLVTGHADRKIRLWHLPDCELVNTLAAHRSAIQSLHISPNGRLLISGGKLGNGTIHLWQLPEGTHLQMLKSEPLEVEYLNISLDGRILLSGGSGGNRVIQLWNLEPLLLCTMPLNQSRPADIHTVQQILQNETISDTDRPWLEFLLALIQKQRRFDIDIQEVGAKIEMGMFDIELAV